MENFNGAPEGAQIPDLDKEEASDKRRFFYSGGLKVSDTALSFIGCLVALPALVYCWLSKTSPGQIAPRGYVASGLVVVVATYYLYPAFVPVVILSAAAGALFFLRSTDPEMSSAGAVGMLLLVIFGVLMSRNMNQYEGDLGDMNTTVEVIKEIESEDTNIDDLPPHIQDQLRSYYEKQSEDDSDYEPDMGQKVPGQPDPGRPGAGQLGTDPFAGYDMNK